jgi:peptide/nickel transport system substrate-binding protein
MGTYISGTSAGDAETLNYILAADSASFSYAGRVLNSLGGYDNEFNLVLFHLARPVEVSPDGLVYTVTIRDDLEWTGGIPVTSEDYVYTLKQLMFADWLNYNYKSDWQEEVNGETVFVEPAVVDKNTFIITRQTVDPEFFDNAIISLTPYPKHIAEKYEGDVKAFTEAPEFNELSYTGNLGAYRFEEWVRNDKYVVSRNPDFYLGREDDSPYFERRVTKLLGTPAAMHAALEAGDITAAGIDPPQVAKFRKMDHINVYTTPTNSYLLVAFNMRDNGWEGFRDRKVRQSLSLAIGKDVLIQSILLGFGEPAFSFIPRPSPWYTEEGVSKYGVEPLYDKEKAKDLLLEAGYGNRQEDGGINVFDENSEPLKLTVVTNSGNKTNESVVFLIKQELSDLGIEVEMKFIPWATELRQYLMNKVPGSEEEPRFNNGPEAVSQEPWDMVVIILSSNPIAPSGSQVFFTCEGGLNFWGYCNEEVDSLFRRAKSEEAVDPENRKMIYAQLSQLMSDDLPADFLAFQAANTGLSKKVEGPIDPGINMGWNYHLWYFVE